MTPLARTPLATDNRTYLMIGLDFPGKSARALDETRVRLEALSGAMVRARLPRCASGSAMNATPCSDGPSECPMNQGPKDFRVFVNAGIQSHNNGGSCHGCRHVALAARLSWLSEYRKSGQRQAYDSSGAHEVGRMD